ncbi:radical SAM protein [Desulfobacterales bacterium HSG16]|nr:radical SAM protein [Desulfobacterales bacterium HSG16]
MNIVLIHPFIQVRDTNIYLSEPLGLISLATYLQQVFGEEIQVSILDLYAMGAGIPKLKGEVYVKGIDDKHIIQEELKKLHPDLIGIGCCFSGYFTEALDVAQMAKEICPSVPIVMGGAHATLEARSILQETTYLDFIVCNEGEVTLEYLVRVLRGEISVKSVDGLCFRDTDNTVVMNPPRQFIENLDILPIPDRTFIDMEYYTRTNHKQFYFSRKKPIATIMTSRGCPYECVFCCSKTLWRRRWRPRSLDKVFEEIEMLVSNYGIREFCILDDQFILNKKRIYAFCDYFIDRNIDIAFSNIAGLSIWLADDDELLIKMRRAGFYKLTLPIESGNPEILRFIRKNIDLEQASRLVKKANQLGYWTGAFFIIGFPHETREQIMQTIAFAYNSQLDFAHFFVAQPYIGTELYDIYRKEDLLKKESMKGTFIFGAWHDTLELKADELNAIQINASRGWMLHKLLFYLHPKNFWNCFLSKFRTFADIRYSFRVLAMLTHRNLSTILKKKRSSRRSHL